jgi:2-polyprenyl-3-methyl-5-hydroxy-6-metoxy-1,4-benzoquinol methylase
MAAKRSQLKSEPQVCDLCGCASYQVFSTRGRWGVPLTTVICRDCGLVYSNPRPTAQENAAFYKQKYWDRYKGEKQPDEIFFRRRLPKIRSMMAELKPNLRPGMKMLEVGSGVGALLSSVKKACNGVGQFTGIEPFGTHAKFCRDVKSLDVHAGLLEEIAPKFEPRSFDLAVMNHVLEHTMSPTSVFTTILSLLKTGGLFVVEVPNIVAPGSRLSHFFHVGHHFNFSPRTLQRLAKKTGCEIVKIEELDGDLPKTRLLGVFRKVAHPKPDVAVRFVRDDPNERAKALKRYESWYWTTFASLRKKMTHWKRQRT